MSEGPRILYSRIKRLELLRKQRENADTVLAVSIVAALWAGCILGYILGMYL